MVQSVNPFDDENGLFHVLRNDEEQHSLWPTFAEVPDGWQVVFESGSREDCLEYVRQNWTDILPLSTRTAIKQARESLS